MWNAEKTGGRGRRTVKRLFDVACAVVGLAIFAPVTAAMAVIIKLEDGGPVFYRGVRVGLGGRQFRMFKFRSMVVDADKIGGSSTADDDPRITRAGRFMRKYKLDELPQLLHVLMGEMSIVGPRPEVPHYVEMFSDEEKAILTVKPGITDWASIWNPDEGVVLSGSADPEWTYMEKIRPEKLRLQLKYVREQSLTTDMQIVLTTAWALLRRHRAEVS